MSLNVIADEQPTPKSSIEPVLDPATDLTTESAAALSPVPEISEQTTLQASTAAVDDSAQPADANVRLSYKFQRLREKLREAISSGELAGRLPGERKLARKFRVNAKTLSKALTDLAAEGLLDRSIGRGTFVKGASEALVTVAAEKWLIICEAEQSRSGVIKRLIAANPDAQCVVGMPPQRPSFLNAFKAVVIFSPIVPDAFIRDLVVRNIAVVVAGRQPSTYSTHTVLIDRSHGAATVARDLMLAGHRRIAIIEERGCMELTAAVRQAAARYAPEAIIEPIYGGEVQSAIEQGATAMVCDSFDVADTARKVIEGLQLAVPGQISISAIGSGDGEYRCSGYFVSPDQFANSIVDLLRDTTAKRPITLFLAGQSIDHGTTGPAATTLDPGTRIRYESVSA